MLIRYADDLVALCHSRQQAEQVKARLAGWLAPRGLAFNEDKTRIVTLDDGFDFLGFTVRRQSRQAADQTEQGGRQDGSGNGCAPRCAPCEGPTRRRCSSDSTRSCGAGRPTTGRWCPARCSPRWTVTCGSSPTSGPSTATRTSRSTGSSDRYFGPFNKSRQDRWVFGDRDSGAYLVKFAWTKIVRHQMVKGGRPRTTPPCPILGRPAAQREHPADGPDQPAPAAAQARPLPSSAGTLLLHADHPPQNPPTNGNSGWRHPQGDLKRAYRLPRPARRTRPSVSCTRTASDGIMPPRHQPSISARPTTPWACLSRMRENRMHGVRREALRCIPDAVGRNLEELFLGRLTYLDAKARGDKSMSGTRRPPGGVQGGVPLGPRDMAKAGLLEAQSPAVKVRTRRNDV